MIFKVQKVKEEDQLILMIYLSNNFRLKKKDKKVL